MKRLSILSMCLAMLLMAGCGGVPSAGSSGETETAEASSSEASSSEASSSEVPAAEAQIPEAPASEAPSAPASQAEEAESSADAAEELGAVPLPLTAEPVTYSIWYCEPFGELVDDPAEDVSVFRLLSERTGIRFEFSLVTMETAKEKFQLLFAADDLTDIITDAMEYYSGSIDDAVSEDAFLLDYSDRLEEMPHYSSVLDQYAEAKKTITSSDTGAMAAFPEIYQDVGDVSGYMVRKDFLDATGMEVPETYEELHDLLTAIHSNTGATLEMIASGGDGLLGAGFGVNVNLDDEDLTGWYVEDGTVKLGVLEPGFRSYLELVKQWYDEGLIYPDFVGTDRGDLSGLFDGSYAVTVKPPEIVAVAEMVIGTSMVAIPMPRETAGEALHVCGNATSCLMDPNAWSINARAQQPELLLSLIDYMFSEEGYYLMNYGEEGVSYHMVDGEPQFTDLVLQNPDGLEYAQAAYLYASSNRSRMPFLSDYARCFAQFTDAQWAALEVYEDDCDHSMDYPLGAVMNTEQSNQYYTVAADICTYISENVLQFIYGQKDMSQWDDFVETIRSMGVDTAIEAKQAAYDDYRNSGS